MRDRLIELKRKFVENFNCGGCQPENDKCRKCLTEKETDYLIENGVIHLPCKIGDTVYAIRDYRGTKYPQKGVVSEMYFLPDMTLQIVVRHISRGEWGKKVFRTEEEAEKRLQKGTN